MKTILITGASRGIGRAIALRLSDMDNARFVITCEHNLYMLNEVCSLIQAKGKDCLCFAGNLGISENVEKLFKITEEAFGKTDILVNNAGASHIGLLSDMTDEEWNNIIASNLNSVFYCCRRAIPGMVHKHEGRILNISSVWGSEGASTEAAYSASKGAVNSLTKSLAKELAPSNIQVNALAPGLIATSMNAHLSLEEMEALYEEIPAGRAGLPEEIAETAYQILTGPSYLTGQIINIDGAWI